jgi:hypothetical protein
MFEGRTLVIATKHKKELVIGPLLEQSLKLKATIVSIIDTDQLGTFTGEVERPLDPLSTAREKCHQAMALSGCDLAVASEGSFGPHPFIFFAQADDELLLFVDKKNDLEIGVRELSLETNFNAASIEHEKQLIQFCERADFPSHAIILRKSKDDLTGMVKGINNLELLKATYHQLINAYGTAYVETDMRALYNPSRMAVIEKATHKLLEKINSRCPACQTPGFGVSGATPGLPCRDCGASTQSTLSHRYSCLKCSYTEEQMYPYQKMEEDPTYCDHCNP